MTNHFSNWYINNMYGSKSDLGMNDIIDTYIRINPKANLLDMALDCYRNSKDYESNLNVAYELECMLFAIFRRMSDAENALYRNIINEEVVTNFSN